MPGHKPNGAKISLEQHVREVLCQISALKARLRAQEQAQQSGSRDSVEIDRKDYRSSRIDYTHRPA